ncbi:MAG: bifunctional 5,10-methylenetetrahydrofolate dehydrogenase/5,10-methenyltetrahydrofolate cyclohydrolase [Hadesarchaea archaeon]|nr:bifunctional 5,10-methylenetetrahydrofolate dehydrogenase/5,10-methenyltetrahydrofolate cyclohydrolase [Hadesarchaea archaeon]
MTIMNGKALAEKIKKEIAEIVKSKNVAPRIATVLVGEDPSSKTYVKLKRKDCQEVGIHFEVHELPEMTSEERLLELIDELNRRNDVHGIIVQLPLPEHLDKRRVISRVEPAKDIDGLHPYNVGKLWLGMYDLNRDLLPCTPKGILKLIDSYEIELEGRRAVIINRSDLVGKPLSKLLLDRNSTVTLCHSRTREIEKHTRMADVLVSAVGRRPHFVVTEDMVKEGAVVIDVGTNYVEGKLCGDVDFERVKRKASYITPVPGGVGPMTRAMLLHNALIASEKIQTARTKES